MGNNGRMHNTVQNFSNLDFKFNTQQPILRAHASITKHRVEHVTDTVYALLAICQLGFQVLPLLPQQMCIFIVVWVPSWDLFTHQAI